MKSVFVVVLMSLLVCCMFETANAQKKESKGESLFMANCKVCHVDGGNIVNPAKTLHKKDRETNHVKTAQDIVKIMRNPGPGMTKFDEKTISNSDAKSIAEYILKTF